MRVLDLDVEQGIAKTAETLGQRGECDLRRVRPEMKHRLSCEHATDRDAVDPSDELAPMRATLPDLDAMCPTELVELLIAHGELGDDPRTLPSCRAAKA